MIRKSRLKKSQVGAPADAEELEAWKEAETVGSMMRRRRLESGSGANVIHREAKTLAKTPYLATLDWVLGLHGSMEDSLLHGLEWYKPKRQRTFNDDFEEDEKDDDNFLVICMDEEQKQLRGYFFMERCLGLNTFLFMPPMHRRHNDWTNAAARSNNYDVVALTIFERNVAFGPYNKGGNAQELWEVGLELMQFIDADDPFLLKVWPLICSGKEWYTDEETCRGARERFIASLTTARPFSVKGNRAAPSKWAGVLRAIEEERPDAGVKLLGIGFIAIKRGWISCWEDLYDQGRKIFQLKDDAMDTLFPEEVEAEVLVEDGAACAAAAPAAVPIAVAKGKGKAKAKPKALSTAKAKAKARAKVSRLISSSANAMHACGRLLTNQDFLDIQEGMYALSVGLLAEHRQAIMTMKSREGMLEYYRANALGSWREPLWSAMETICSLKAFRRVVGLTTEFPAVLKKRYTPDHPTVVAEDNLARTFWNFTSHLLAERAASCQRYSTSYPLLLGGMLGDESEIIATIAKFKIDWEAYCSARCCKIDVVMTACDRSSLNSRAMEQTARYAKRAGWMREPAFEQRVRHIFNGVNNEDLVEDTLGKVMDAEYRDCASRAMRCFKAYEVAHVNRQLGRWGQTEVEVTTSLAIEASSASYDAYFDVRPSTKLPFHKVLQGGDLQEFDSFTPTTLRTETAEMALRRWIYLNGDSKWALWQEVWRSQVVPSHCVFLIRRPLKPPTIHYALFPTAAGVLCSQVLRCGTTYVRYGRRGSTFDFVPIFDFDEVEIIPITPISALSSFLLDFPEDEWGICAKHGAPVPLLRYQAARGFGGVSETVMKKVYRDLGKIPPEPSGHDAVPLEFTLAAGLAELCLPDLGTEEMATAMHSRMSTETSACEGLAFELLNDDCVRDVLRDSDKKLWNEMFDKAKDMKSYVGLMAPRIKAFCSDTRRKTKKVGKLSAAQLDKIKQREELSTKDGAARWWASVPGDDKFINQYKPEPATVCTDHPNGRFLGYYRGY